MTNVKRNLKAIKYALIVEYLSFWMHFIHHEGLSLKQHFFPMLRLINSNVSKATRYYYFQLNLGQFLLAS